MDIVRRVWREYAPFDYEDEFYRLAQAHSQVRAKQRPHVPLYFGGTSEAALEVGGTPGSTPCGASRWRPSRGRLPTSA